MTAEMTLVSRRIMGPFRGGRGVSEEECPVQSSLVQSKRITLIKQTNKHGEDDHSCTRTRATRLKKSWFSLAISESSRLLLQSRELLLAVETDEPLLNVFTGLLERSLDDFTPLFLRVAADDDGLERAPGVLLLVVEVVVS